MGRPVFRETGARQTVASWQRSQELVANGKLSVQEKQGEKKSPRTLPRLKKRMRRFVSVCADEEKMAAGRDYEKVREGI